MRIRQSPSGPFVGRAVVYSGARWAPTVPPFATVTVPGPIEIPSLEFPCVASAGDVISVSPLFLAFATDAAATLTLQARIRKPDGTLTDFTNPQPLTFTFPFPAPGSDTLLISAVEYNVPVSGAYAVVVLAGTTAGTLTLNPGTSYGVLVL